MNTGWMGNQIVHIEETDSTNNELKRRVKELTHGTVLVADRQTAGKGRFGRNWNSPKNEGLWMSFVMKPTMTPKESAGLTLVIALAMTKVLRRLTGLDVGIKWPNDLVCNGKKLGGILTEISTEGMNINYIIAGIGINLVTTEFPKDLQEIATSLKLEGASGLQWENIVTEFDRSFEEYYEIYERYRNMSGIRTEYEELLINCGKEVRVIDGENTMTGVAQGINDEGELIFQGENGTQTIRAGEVSVRGIYGYV